MKNYNSYATVGSLDTRIRKTLTNTFISVGVMWLIVALASYLTVDTAMSFGTSIALLIGSFGCLFGIFLCRDNAFGLVLLAGFAGLEGLSLGPVLGHYLHLRGGTELVMQAASLTGLATFGCAAYCVTTRKSFSHLGGFLFASLFVLLGAMVLSIFVHSAMLNLGISVAAAVIFTIYLLYDISNVVTGQETNYIIAALNVFLDMLNLFLHLLNILSVFNSNDD